MHSVVCLCLVRSLWPMLYCSKLFWTTVLRHSSLLISTFHCSYEKPKFQNISRNRIGKQNWIFKLEDPFAVYQHIIKLKRFRVFFPPSFFLQLCKWTSTRLFVRTKHVVFTFSTYDFILFFIFIIVVFSPILFLFLNPVEQWFSATNEVMNKYKFNACFWVEVSNGNLKTDAPIKSLVLATYCTRRAHSIHVMDEHSMNNKWKQRTRARAYREKKTQEPFNFIY